MAVVMVSFRCPTDLKEELMKTSERLCIDQSVLINQGIRIRLDEIKQGIIEGPSFREKRTGKRPRAAAIAHTAA